MKVKVLAFGIAKDIFGNSYIELELSPPATVRNLQTFLEQQFPRLQQLATYRMAVNDEYAAPDNPIQDSDEIAVIPPVSGG